MDLEQESCKIRKILASSKSWHGFGTDFLPTCQILKRLGKILPDIFDRASKPKGVTVNDKTRDSITLSWKEPLIGGANVSHYEVYVNGSRACDEIGHTCTVNGLEPGSEYRITVHAACDMGLCEGSEELLVTLFKAKE